MIRRKRLPQDPASRLMRRAVAYDRLAAKAYRNGEHALMSSYMRRSSQLRDQASRIRQRAQASAQPAADTTD